MILEQARRWRTWAGKLVALLIVLMFTAMFEGLVAKFRQPFNEYEVLPGDVVNINGPLAEEGLDLQDLTYYSNSEHLQVSFLETHRGFWLGGSMWRGKLRVSPLSPPGKYALAVAPKHPAPDKPPQFFSIVVYPDSLSLKENSRSIITRRTGMSPWAAVGLFLALISLTLGAVLFLGVKIEKLMAQKGQAEIYRVEKLERGYAFAFGLGTKHGVKADDTVAILDPEGRQVGSAEIQKVALKDSVGMTGFDLDIRPGYIVSLNR